MNKTLTDICELVVDQPLPPPPGLNQVFKDIRPRGAESAVSPIWNLLTDEWKAFRAFLRTPVGACLATMLFSYGMLAVGFKGQDIELMIGSISVNYLTEGVWFMLFRILFLGLSFAWKPWFIYTSGYLFLLADWAFWLQDQGLKEPSWVSRAVLLTLCVVGYMHGKSSTTRFSVLFLSILVPGETCSHKLVAICHFLTGTWRVTSLSVSILRCLV